MDDIFENLGIILLIVISVAAQIAKVAKKASKNAETPSVEQDAPAQEGTAAQNTYGDTTFSDVRPKVMQHILSTSAKRKKQKKNPASPDLNRVHTAENKPKDEAADTDNAKPAVSADDFDIRQAIIYSEIMAPKFKEE